MNQKLSNTLIIANAILSGVACYGYDESGREVIKLNEIKKTPLKVPSSPQSLLTADAKQNKIAVSDIS